MICRIPDAGIGNLEAKGAACCAIGALSLPSSVTKPDQQSIGRNEITPALNMLSREGIVRLVAQYSRREDRKHHKTGPWPFWRSYECSLAFTQELGQRSQPVLRDGRCSSRRRAFACDVDLEA
jgi:hypothetical protein